MLQNMFRALMRGAQKVEGMVSSTQANGGDELVYRGFVPKLTVFLVTHLKNL
jgi:hypothetical protein